MTIKEAIIFCETTECEDCPAYGNDKRTREEYLNHTPCCINLVTTPFNNKYKEEEEK